MADDAAAPDAAPAGGNADAAQQAAVAAAEQAVANFEANEAAAGGEGTGVGGDAQPEALRVEDLVDFEDRYSRGLAVAGLEADELDAGDVDGDDLEAEAADEVVEDELPAAESDEPAVDEADATDGEAEEEPSVPTDPDERLEWLPEDPSQYDLPAIPDPDHQWTDGDKDAWASFNKTAHQQNLPQGVLDSVGAWYVDRLKTVKETFQRLDADHAKAARATLSETLGDDAAATIAAANAAYKAGLPQEFRALLRETRLPNGKKLVNEPAFVQMMATLAKAQAPSVDSRLDTIREIMRTDRNKYFAQGLDREFLELETRKANGPGAGAAPVHSDADSQEIASILRILNTDRDRYFSEGHDKRYADLLRKREAKQGQAA